MAMTFAPTAAAPTVHDFPFGTPMIFRHGSPRVPSCGRPRRRGSEATPRTPQAEVELQDAEDVLLALKAVGLPLGDSIVYIEETDENDLLGRPGQDTSKVNFNDTRLEKLDDFDTEGGGSVEMFNNGHDAQERYDYVDSITSGSPMFLEYHWLNGKAFLRLGKALTPSQVDEYKAAFDELDLG